MTRCSSELIALSLEMVDQIECGRTIHVEVVEIVDVCLHGRVPLELDAGGRAIGMVFGFGLDGVVYACRRAT